MPEKDESAREIYETDEAAIAAITKGYMSDIAVNAITGIYQCWRTMYPDLNRTEVALKTMHHVLDLWRK